MGGVFESANLLSWVATLVEVASIAFIPVVLLRRKDPAATFAWILVLLFMPGLGVFLFWFFGRDKMPPVRRRGGVAKAALRKAGDGSLAFRLEELIDQAPEAERGLMRLTSCLGRHEPVAGNALEVLVGAQSTSAALLEAIEAAQDHVHLEYYIFRADEDGRPLLSALIAAAERGVQIRLLYDGYGSAGLRRHLGPLKRAGGKAAPFFPFAPFSFLRRAWSWNLRNHRKLVVVDGQTAFAGGINIGDIFSTWRDVHLRLQGPVVADLQALFVADWKLATKRELPADSAKGMESADSSLFPALGPEGDALLQVLPSGPDESQHSIHHLYFAAIASAQERVWITTPYFVPDPALSLALRTAALRGVEVRLIVPRSSNHQVVFHAGRSFYQELLFSGVHVHEYLPGMLHTKAMVIDGRMATLGSANLDMRSFRLNFELLIVLYRGHGVDALAMLFLEDLDSTEEVTLEYWRLRSLPTRITEGFSRLMSPLL